MSLRWREHTLSHQPTWFSNSAPNETACLIKYNHRFSKSCNIDETPGANKCVCNHVMMGCFLCWCWLKALVGTHHAGWEGCEWKREVTQWERMIGDGESKETGRKRPEKGTQGDDPRNQRYTMYSLLPPASLWKTELIDLHVIHPLSVLKKYL